MAMNALELTFPALRRDGRIVLEAGSATLRAGRGIAVTGLNGAGKTTFLMAIAGLLRGADMVLNGVPASRMIVGYAPQNAPLPSWLAVRDVFRLYGSTLSAAAIACPGLRLEEIEGLAVRHLTPGQKQALAAAVTLISSAEMLVLDEPFTSLDFHRQRALRSALADAAAVRTVIVSAQSITDAFEFCDRFIILREGRIVFAGHTTDIGMPADAGVAELEKFVLDLVLDSRLEVSA